MRFILGPEHVCEGSPVCYFLSDVVKEGCELNSIIYQSPPSTTANTEMTRLLSDSKLDLSGKTSDLYQAVRMSTSAVVSAKPSLCWLTRPVSLLSWNGSGGREGREGFNIDNVIRSWDLSIPLAQGRICVMDFMTSSYFLRKKKLYLFFDGDTQDTEKQNHWFFWDGRWY